MVRAWHTAIAATVLVAGIGLASGTMAQSTAPQAKGNAAPAPAAKAAAKKPTGETKKDPSIAQGQIDAAVASLGSGKLDVAVQQLTAVLSGGGLPAAQMARALYYRGLAYRKQSKPAQAIADLTSALWLKNGLAAAERADALENRAAAYREAGLSDQADADMAKVASTRTGKSGADTQASAGGGQVAAVATKTAAAPQAEAKAESAAPASSSSSGGGGGIGSFFGNIFGGGTASASAEQPKPAPRTASVSEWSASTEVRTAAGKAGVATVAPDTTASIGKAQVVAAQVAQKAYTLQVAAVRSRAEAQAVAQKLKQQHAADIGGRNTEIDEAVVGNMGTLYRVRVGPFADANEPRSLCTKLRSTGLDCMLVTQ